MPAGVLDIFTIGIGPSSSHTVGPMRASRRFAAEILGAAGEASVDGVEVELYGSLAATGRGHGTPGALVSGLEGEEPEMIDPAGIPGRLDRISHSGRLLLARAREVPFDLEASIVWRTDASLPRHANGMLFRGRIAGGITIERVYYSTGGGFVAGADLEQIDGSDAPPAQYPYFTAAEWLDIAEETGLGLAGVVRKNEEAVRSAEELDRRLDRVWQAMRECVSRGLRAEGYLPGGLNLKRRAPEVFARMAGDDRGADDATLLQLDWTNLYALAASEENAAGGRIVTAPTAGACGVVPAVLLYYANRIAERKRAEGDRAGAIRTFLLVAGAVGALFKERASISGAEVGCQGEVGVATSMAAAGLAAARGCADSVVENAAEIAMEHSLGLTCDPVGGLVQIPCIERNAMGAVKAINAARLAEWTGGRHVVSLDRVMDVMRETGHDMSKRYKETSQGGLAQSVPIC